MYHLVLFTHWVLAQHLLKHTAKLSICAFYKSRLMNYLNNENVEFFIRTKNTAKLDEAVYSEVRNIEDYTAENPYNGKIIYTVSEMTYRLVFKFFLRLKKAKRIRWASSRIWPSAELSPTIQTRRLKKAWITIKRLLDMTWSPLKAFSLELHMESNGENEHEASFYFIFLMVIFLFSFRISALQLRLFLLITAH